MSAPIFISIFPEKGFSGRMGSVAAYRGVLGRFSQEKQESLLKLAILSIAAVLAFSTRLFSVLRFESVIHEFDPYFNYRTTKYLAEEGFYNFHGSNRMNLDRDI